MTRSRVALPAALGLALALAACTDSSSTPEPPEDGRPSATAAESSGGTGTATPSADAGDVSPDELSADLFAQSAAAARQEPVGSATGVPEASDPPTTVEVLEVRAVEDGTVVRLSMTATETYQLGPAAFAESRFGSLNFVGDVALEVPASGTRLLPLQFEDFRKACVCPYKPMELGPEPTSMTALFGLLPEGTESVTVSLPGETPLVIEDVPVTT